MSRRRSKSPPEPLLASVESLSHEGRGIARIDGKTVFVDGALPGERVRFLYTRKRGQFDEGRTVEVLDPSPLRVEPRCQHYGICGGCNLMHLDGAEQLRHKQAALLEQLQRLGGVEPERIIPPLAASGWGYRRKARLGVKYVAGKGRALVGFREKYSSFIADIDSCKVLHPTLGEAIGQLGKLIQRLSVYRQIPQLEAAISDAAGAIVIRHLAPLSDADRDILSDFEAQSPLRFYMQPGGLDSIHSLSGEDGQNLYYRLDRHDITIEFSPTDFTQVHFGLNAMLVDRVIELLEPSAADDVLDLFCGLGNFTLPLARYANQAIGLEGAQDLALRAQANARKNSLANVEFSACDLTAPDAGAQVSGYAYNKVLLDPPRSGAREIIEQLALQQVTKLVYISCNPATLARDAGILVKQRGLRLQAAGVMDMFPHTSHVESIALFE